MRIDDLIKREPFGEILRNTVARYGESTGVEQSSINWSEKRKIQLYSSDGDDCQIWHCNHYLNAIFYSHAHKGVFEPIINEYSRSILRHRRLAQKLYVRMAVSGLTRSTFAHSTLTLEPGLPAPENLLIMAGNTRIRVINRSEGWCDVVPKEGFGKMFFENELKIRLNPKNLPVPGIVSHQRDVPMFREEYVSGIPVNRIRDPERKWRSIGEAADSLYRYSKSTSFETSTENYLDQRRMTYANLIEKIPNGYREGLLKALDQLSNVITRLSSSVTLATVHGDFHPGNLLWTSKGIILIDWEYSGERVIMYDPMVFSLQSRAPAGLAARLDVFLAQGPWKRSLFPHFNDNNWNDLVFRKWALACFILEDLITILTENFNDLFYLPGKGLIEYTRELPRIISTLSKSG